MIRQPTGSPALGRRTHPRMAAALFLALASCGPGDSLTTPGSQPNAITLSPSSLSFASLGGTQSLTATVRDENGETMSTVLVDWSSSNDEIASVAAEGTVTAVANGVATITATAGAVSATAEVTVQQVPSAITLSASSLSFTSLGGTQSLTATVRDEDGEIMSTVLVDWSSSNDEIASVAAEGTVKAVANGVATITATAGAVSATAEVTVQQVVTSVRFTDPVMIIRVDHEPMAPEVVGEDANGHPAPLDEVEWSSSDSGVLYVDASGTVTPVSAGWAMLTATVEQNEASAIIHVASPGFPGLPSDMRSIHLGGNWLGNRLWAGHPPEEFWQFVDSLSVNWVGISVALFYDESTDPIVKRKYTGVGIPTFSDEVLRALIREFRSRDIEVYVTLAFENESQEGSQAPPRWMIGQPWLELDYTEENWPWLPDHPDHEEFVSQFWASYTEQAVYFARIAGEEGASLFSLGTESDRLFRTRTEGLWVTEFRDEIQTMVAEVKSVFSGLVTYDQVYEALANPGFWGIGPSMLWEDGDFDVIGISAWFRLVPDEPTSVMSVAALQERWEAILRDVIQPLQQANPTRPIMFTEFGYVSDVRAPANPTIEEFQEEVFLDANGNLLDDGEEVQANIIEAFYRALDVYPGVRAAFHWDHATDADAEIEAESTLRSTRVRGKLAEEVLKLIYRGAGLPVGQVR